MTPERWKQINDLLQAALECEPDERNTFLDNVCAGDPDLRRQLEALIAADAQATDFLEEPALIAHGDSLRQEAATPSLPDDQADSLVGQRIGSYKILGEISRGGMGVVYLATRADQEYRKQVAIKLVKHGMDTDAIVRRFRQERQILAALDHPNIAKLLDGGTTDEGLPYFVMDYVDGLPIDVYSDRQKLSVQERLTLFRTVCSAVHYAHQHRVIHRDLKPSNILVTEDGVPKLLDFGIAKVLDPELYAQTVESTMLVRPMTPEYASPEQVRGKAVTPASDVYSLGVLLYELLTGHRPYRVSGRSLSELEWAICEQEPEKPSRAISRVEEVQRAEGPLMLTPESVSQTREGEPEKLRRQLAGDLDAIVLKALRKEPDERYASVEAFSEDIRRHLEGRPVLARKGTVRYRTAKFMKRNKAGVIAAAFFAALLIGLSLTLSLLLQQEKVADQAIESVAVLPFVNASGDSDLEYLSDGITESLITSLSQLPNLKVIARTTAFRYKGKAVEIPAVRRELKVAAVLTGRVVQRGDGLSISIELVDARDSSLLWGGHYNRKLSDILTVQEEIAQQVSQKLRFQLTGKGQPQLFRRSTENTEAYQLYLKGRYLWNRRTEESMKKSLEYFEQAISLDPNYALAYAGLADSYNVLSQFGELSPHKAMPKAKAAATSALRIDDTLAEAHASMALIHAVYDWEWEGAEAEFKRAIELNPNYATAHHWYALFLSAMGRHDEALAEIRKAKELDPISLMINTNEGWILFCARQYDRAIEQLRATIEMEPNFANAHYKLALVYEMAGRYKEAVEEYAKDDLLSGMAPEMVNKLRAAYAKLGWRGYWQKELERLRESSQRGYVLPKYFVLTHLQLGETEEALKWLEKSYQERDEGLLYLKVDPRFDRLRSDPRFQDLLRRVGLLN